MWLNVITLICCNGFQLYPGQPIFFFNIIWLLYMSYPTTQINSESHSPLLDLLSWEPGRLSTCKWSSDWHGKDNPPVTPGLRESQRLAALCGLPSSTWADGVWVSTLRVLLRRVISGMGARWPSGMSWAFENSRKEVLPQLLNIF